MDHIVVDDSFTRQLPGAEAPMVVFDATGKRLGYFTPEINPALYQGVNSSVSDDELLRRERAGGGRSLQEILNDFHKNPGQ